MLSRPVGRAARVSIPSSEESVNVLSCSASVAAAVCRVALHVGCGGHLEELGHRPGHARRPALWPNRHDHLSVPADGAPPRPRARSSRAITRSKPLPGPKKVEIVASKVVGQRPAYEGDPNSRMIRHPSVDHSQGIQHRHHADGRPQIGKQLGPRFRAQEQAVIARSQAPLGTTCSGSSASLDAKRSFADLSSQAGAWGLVPLTLPARLRIPAISVYATAA